GPGAGSRRRSGCHPGRCGCPLRAGAGCGPRSCAQVTRLCGASCNRHGAGAESGPRGPDSIQEGELTMSMSVRGLLAGLLVLCGLGAAGNAQAEVVVSQVYGAGGNSGAVFDRDYVELFNRGGTPV